MRRWRKGCLLVLVVFSLYVGACLWANPDVFQPWYWNYHQHCIKYAGMGLEQYAAEHDGKYPYDPRGYGDALLLLDPGYYHALTGPGYDAEPLRRAKREGKPLAEDECGRVYVQGLTTKNNPEIVLLFDKLPTQGGDHRPPFLRLFGSLRFRSRCREVWKVGGMGLVSERSWPEFTRQQVELLVKEGIDHQEAERLYASKSR
jgi:hypothetical protein